MEGEDRLLTTSRSFILVALAVGAFLVRFPWQEIGGVGFGAADGRLWPIATHAPTPWTVGVGLEFLLIGSIVYTVLPVLYPSRASGLTRAFAYRGVVTTLSTGGAFVVFLAVSEDTSASPLFGLLAATFVGAVVATSRTNNWRFSTPYVSPVFAVLSSFVPTARVTEFAASFRRGETDPRTRWLFQGLLGIVTVGVVLIVALLSALPPLVFPSLEILTVGAVAAVTIRRLGVDSPTARRRHRQHRAAARAVRRVLRDTRATTAVLLATTGALLGASSLVLGAAVGVSAARRTPGALATPATAFTSSGVAVEWLVVGYLCLHAAAVARFWSRMLRRLPTSCPSTRGLLRSDGGEHRTASLDALRGPATRPNGLLLTPTLLLVVAVWLLYPRSVPGSNSAVLAVAASILAAVTVVYTWILDERPLVLGVSERYVLPAAFTVQWVGTMTAITLLPGYTLETVAPVTALVLLVALGSFFYVELANTERTVGPVNVRSVYLFGLSVASFVLLWFADDTLLGYVGPLLWPIAAATATGTVGWALYQYRQRETGE